MKTKKILFFICLILLSFNTVAQQQVSVDKPQKSFAIKTFAQLIPSIYIGCGTGTNIGGVFGIGSEIKYKMVSLNVATGSMFGDDFLVFSSAPNIGSSLWFGYDFGVKLHSDLGAFFGVNYGIIGASKYYTEKDLSQDFPQYESVNGFSFSLGYRHSIYKNFYGQYFIGLTSKKKYNYMDAPILDAKYIYPRIGLIMGYEFKNSRNMRSNI